jgi:hypothetical protein
LQPIFLPLSALVLRSPARFLPLPALALRGDAGSWDEEEEVDGEEATAH